MTRLTKLELQNALEKAGIEYPATATVSQLRALLEEDDGDDSDSGVAAAAAAGGESHDGDGNVEETDDAENLDEQIAVLEKRKKMLLLQKELQALELDAISARQRITVMDIDGMVPKFSGDNAYPVEKWINDFENAVKVGNKDDHFKYMCMRRLLSGTAAIFLRTSIASNYCELKAALVKQFHRNVSTNDVYKELYRRRRSPNESIIAYMLSIKEIAAQANLNEDEIINAVIEGLRDNTAYTSILYTAKNLDELQQLLLKYDKKKTNDNTTKKLQTLEGGSKTVSSTRCFNCSQYGHLSHQCKEPKRVKGSCFRCGSKDHMLNQCKQPPMKTVNAVDEEPTHEDMMSNVEPYQTAITNMGRYVVYDCDTGNDDAWGLMMLIKAEEAYKRLPELTESPAKFEIIGVTCVQGNSTVEQIVINTLRVLNAANRNDIPIYKGCGNPIIPRNWENAENFHGKDGFGEVEHMDHLDMSLVRPEHAVNAMYDFVRRYPKKVDFLLVGPMTNFATCINMYGSDFLDKIGNVFIMGGNYKGVGNINKCAEFNFMMDPEAAHIVLANVKTTLTILPWEPCLHGEFDTTVDWRLNVLGSVRSTFMELLNRVEHAIFVPKGMKRYLVCDPILVAAYIFPHLIIGESRLYYTTVELAGIYTRGQMVMDHLRQERDNARIILEVNGEEFKKILSWTAGLEGIDMECELGKAEVPKIVVRESRKASTDFIEWSNF